jgi:cytosine/adenosine deaminase-related metal-dependent hydrolase
MKKYTADYIFTKSSSFEENIVIIAQDNGVIIELDDVHNHDQNTIQSFSGALVPGFINTHCHLELSHMKGIIDTGTTLLPFIEQVVKYRHFEADIIANAIEQADREMYENGIVAVGDISNSLDSLRAKSTSKLFYYTFVEYFDLLNPNLTNAIIKQYDAVYEGQSDHNQNKKSAVPHAPYSVTQALFAHINAINDKNSTVSIHNQETVAENILFLTGEGAFKNFFSKINNPLLEFKPMYKPSIYYAMENMRSDQKVIFVHNTMTTKEDIEAAHRWNDQVFWATCPNANLYIENKLPDYKQFIDSNANITIGTDSLTSNWHLSIWKEIAAIKKYCSYIKLEDIMTWATINGAKALGYDAILGSFEKGKNPGIVQVDVTKDGRDFIIGQSKPNRIA